MTAYYFISPFASLMLQREHPTWAWPPTGPTPKEMWCLVQTLQRTSWRLRSLERKVRSGRVTIQSRESLGPQFGSQAVKCLKHSSPADSISQKASVENQDVSKAEQCSEQPEDGKVLSDQSVIADSSNVPADPVEPEREPETQTEITEWAQQWSFCFVVWIWLIINRYTCIFACLLDNKTILYTCINKNCTVVQ